MWWTKAFQCAQMVRVLELYGHIGGFYFLDLFLSENLAIQRSHFAAVHSIRRLGHITGVLNPFLGWVCAFGRAAKHRLRDTRNENNPARRGSERISDIQNSGGQGDRVDSHTGQRHATWKRSECLADSNRNVHRICEMICKIVWKNHHVMFAVTCDKIYSVH